MILSIIVPVYNLEQFISATLDSLTSMEFPFKHEIIIVNDGSNDGSEGIIKEYQKRFSNIKLITIKNSGVSNARNIGVNYARGKYISFVDGDDTVEKTFFKRALYEIENNNYDFVQGNYRTVFDDHTEYHQCIPEDREFKTRVEMLEFFLGKQSYIYNAVWGKVFNTDLVKKHTFDIELKVAEDQKFVFDIINSSKKIKLINEVGYNYYQRTTSVMHTMNEEKELDKLKVFEYMKEKSPCEKITNYIESYEIMSLLTLYNSNLRKNESGEVYVNTIKNICKREIMPLLDIGTRLKINVLLRLKFVYDFLLRVSR